MNGSQRPASEREVADSVEQASIESLPAGDPPAWTPVSGVRAAARPAERGEEFVGADQASSDSGAAAEPGGGPATGIPDAEVADLRDRLLRALAEQEVIGAKPRGSGDFGGSPDAVEYDSVRHVAAHRSDWSAT